MKILHVSYIFPPKLNVGDGITTVVHELSREQIRQGHEVTIITSNALETTGSKRIEAGKITFNNGLLVYYLNSLMRYRTHILTPSIFTLLHEIIDNFDIIHVHDARSFQGLAVAFYAHLRQIPYVYQPHGSFLSKEPKSLTTRIMRKLLDIVSKEVPIHSDCILALNRTEFNLFAQQLDISLDKITVLPNGIDFSKYPLSIPNQFREKFGISNEHFILYLGRLHRSKGIELLLKAFAQLTYLIQEDVVLVLAGPDDGFEQEAKSLIEKLGIHSKVVFTGFLTDNMKLAALNEARVFATPLFTGFPITFLESCIMGLPIVTTTLGDELDWIDKQVGFVTPPQPTSIANAMKDIISNELLYNEFSRNARNIAKESFSINRVTADLVRIYQEVIILKKR